MAGPATEVPRAGAAAGSAAHAPVALRHVIEPLLLERKQVAVSRLHLVHLRRWGMDARGAWQLAASAALAKLALGARSGSALPCTTAVLIWTLWQTSAAPKKVALPRREQPVTGRTHDCKLPAAQPLDDAIGFDRAARLQLRLVHPAAAQALQQLRKAQRHGV